MSLKITDVKIIVTCPGRNYVVVKILTNEPGLYGVGDATLNGRELAVASILQEHIAPLLIGRDPAQIEDIWQYLYRGPYWRGGPVQMTALAGIDLALWDIKGKVANLPLYQLLGGRTRFGARAYTHAGGRDIPELLDSVIAAAERGFTAIRVQCAVPGAESTYGVGGAQEATAATWKGINEADYGDGGPMPPVEPNWDTRKYLSHVPRFVEAVRNSPVGDVDLLHDVHERLTPIEAARLLKDLEPYNLLFLEDPLRPDHKESFRLLRNHSATPIAMGELFHSKYDCLTLITEQLIDYIRCDVGHIGGITEARKIAAIAEPYQVLTAWHGPGDIGPATHSANVHMDCSIPNFGIQEMVFFDDRVNEVLPGAPRYENGYLLPNETPGLGVDVDEKLAAKYPYHRAYLPVVRKFDGSVHDW